MIAGDSSEGLMNPFLITWTILLLFIIVIELESAFEI